MVLTPEFIFQILVAIGGGVGTYAAIRADLARLHERTEQTRKTADHAHTRIDGILTQHAK